LRKHNKDFERFDKIGKNTYPYVNGIIWDSERSGNLINIVSNRAGGVSIEGKRSEVINFYLTRSLNNVNWDKGLPDKLEDNQ